MGQVLHISDSDILFKLEDAYRRCGGANFSTETCDNYPKTYIDSDDPEKYKDVYWVRIYEDGNIEKIDVGGPRYEKNN